MAADPPPRPPPPPSANHLPGTQEADSLPAPPLRSLRELLDDCNEPSLVELIGYLARPLSIPAWGSNYFPPTAALNSSQEPDRRSGTASVNPPAKARTKTPRRKRTDYSWLQLPAISGHIPADVSHRKKCSNCQAEDTPQWRSGPAGRKLCNACGLHYRRGRYLP